MTFAADFSLSLHPADNFAQLAITHEDTRVVIRQIDDRHWAIFLQAPQSLEIGLSSPDNGTMLWTFDNLEKCVTTAIRSAATNHIFFERLPK